MLKKITYTLQVVVLGLLMQPWANATDFKTAYVDVARLLEEAPQAGIATKRIKEEFAPREKEIHDAQAALKSLEEKLSRDGLIMSASERKKTEQDLHSRKRELGRKQDEFREDLNIRRNDEIGKLQKLIKQAIEAVGKMGNYDLIFYEGIAFANSKLDVTDKVLEHLRQQSEAAPKKAQE